MVVKWEEALVECHQASEVVVGVDSKVEIRFNSCSDDLLNLIYHIITMNDLIDDFDEFKTN